MKPSGYSDKAALAADQNEKEGAYWLETLAGEWEKSCFPYDFQERFDERKALEKTFTGNLSAKVQKLSGGVDVKLHMVLVAGLVLLLHKYTGRDDILVGSPILKQDVDGDFINRVLAFRNRVTPGMSFKDLLLAVRATIVGANENQNYPFEVLADRLGISDTDEGYSFFDVAVLLKQLHDKNYIENIPYSLLFAFEKTEDKLSMVVDYNCGLYSSETVERIMSRYMVILDRALEDVNASVNSIDIMIDGELEQVLTEFSGDVVASAQIMEGIAGKTIQQLFREQTMKSPDNIAVVGSKAISIVDGDDTGAPVEEITFKRLSVMSGRLAAVLRSREVGPGSIVGMIVEPSIDMFSGIFGILEAGGAYLPIDPTYPDERIDFMLSDSGVHVLLSSRMFDLEGRIDYRGEVIYIEDIIYEDKFENTIDMNVAPVEANLNDPVYIIYTSGTTGKPKGVLVEQGNVSAYLQAFYREFDISATDSVIQLASYSFDVFVEEVFPVLFRGGRVVIPDPSLMMDINGLCKWISDYSVTIIDCTPLLLKEFNKIAAEEPGNNPLTGVRIFISGGDVLKAEYVDHLAKSGQVYNTYGPTESTVCATYYRYKPVTGHHIPLSIPIGKPVYGYRVSILDETGSPVPIGIAGELCVSGPGVARGYLNRSELTAERFFCHGQTRMDDTGDSQSHPSHPSYPSHLSHRSYRTGDKVRWMADGNIQYIGRIDDQVKIRGYRIETGEIEKRLMANEHIEDAVVIARGNAEKFLCAYVVITNGGTEPAGHLREYLSHRLPAYMIPSFFVTVDKIPLTVNGKVDRKVLPLPQAEAGTTYVAPQNDVQKRLQTIWQEVLGVARVGIYDNFFDVGGHSLRGVQVLNDIHKVFDVKIPLAEMFKIPTIKELSEYIGTAAREEFSVIEPVEEKEYYSLSPAQRRLYVLHGMDPTGTAYNMPQVLNMEAVVDRQRLEATFQRLVKRHESLRTSFEMVGDAPVQRIHRNVPFYVDYFDLSQGGAQVEASSVNEIITGFSRRFELSKAPLLRAKVIILPGSGWILLVDIHHIISDGISMMVLTDDFVRLYDGEILPLLKIRYKDFSQWQNNRIEGGGLVAQEDYWLSVFSHKVPRLELPADNQRPPVFTFQGRAFGFVLRGEDSERFIAICAANEGTLYMNILAALNTLFYKYTGQKDIVIGSGIAGRDHADLQRVIGMFVNTLAMRNYPEGGKTYEGFFKEVINNSLQAFENQDVQFEDLVEKLDLERDPSRNPLFDVSMVLQNTANDMEVPPVPEIPETGVGGDDDDSTILYRHVIAKFDMTFFVQQAGNDIHLGLEYYSPVYNEDTVKRLASHFKRVVKTVAANPSIYIRDIDILSEEEKHQLLVDFNGPEREYPSENNITDLFSRWVDRVPDAIAVVGLGPGHGGGGLESVSLSYRQVDEASNRLARYLRHQAGIGLGDRVGVSCSRLFYLPVYLLGILKAGAVYVPLDPMLPEERIRYMKADAGINVVLSNELPVNLASYDGGEVDWDAAGPEDLAYIIYTSGTTGVPKGVMLEHGGGCNLDLVSGDDLGIGPYDNVLQFANISFDASVWEMFMALLSGASLHMMTREAIDDMEMFYAFIDRHNITVTLLPPPYAHNLEERRLKGLRVLLTGGSAPNPDFIGRWASLFRYVNAYGPTESTVCCTLRRYEPKGHHRASIGRPIPNTMVTILNHDGQIQPVGVAGELCVSGAGLARGYLNQPELTSQCFLYYGQTETKTRKNTLLSRPVPGDSHSHRSHPSHLSHRYYRTGDKARWLPDGNIEYLGRLDFQVKIRGFRIELGEIETSLLRHESVSEAVVMDRKLGGGEANLNAFVVPCEGCEFSPEELKKYLSRTLPDYMVPPFFIRMEGIPLTYSGKVDRKALNRFHIPPVGGGLGPAAPENRVEEELLDIWYRLLSVDKGDIGIDTNFFRVGGHSLNATVLITQIHKVFNVKVPLSEVFRNPTIRKLASFIIEANKDIYASICPVEERDYYPLSAAQKRMFILSRVKEPNDTSDNTPAVMTLTGMADANRLETTIWKLIQRHDVFRTSFHLLGDEAIQRVHKKVDFTLEHFNIEDSNGDKTGEIDINGLIQRFIQPFDLSRAPLLRVGLLKIPDENRGEDEKHLLMYDMHHIIRDAQASQVFVEDFSILFGGGSLPPMKLQYKDFTVWQNNLFASGTLVLQQEYWLNRFSGDLPVLDMPTDFSRPAVWSSDGRTVRFALTPDRAAVVEKLKSESGATLYMVLLAVYTLLLSKYSSQEDIIVGTPIAGRPHADLQNIVGFFVNTLAMRNFPEKDKTFCVYLEEVKTNALDAYANQDYPFDSLVEKLNLRRDKSRSILFDTMFVVQNTEAPATSEDTDGIDMRDDDEDVRFEAYAYEENITQFDIIMHAFEVSGNISFMLRYCTKLFTQETIDMLIDNMIEIIDAVGDNMEIKLGDIKLAHHLKEAETEMPDTGFMF